MSESQPSPTPGDDSIDREIAHHINTLTDAYIAQGISPEEARRRALVEFGGREQVKQAVREVHLSAFAESIAFHLKAALRFLHREPASHHVARPLRRHRRVSRLHRHLWHAELSRALAPA